LIGHNGRVCPILIPSGHSGETSQDDSLHKAYISCPAFKGKNSNGIHKLFRDSLREIYDKIFDIDAEPLPIPEDYYTAISNATEATGEEHTTMVDDHNLIYLFEYYKITKVGGVNSPYAYAEWPNARATPQYTPRSMKSDDSGKDPGLRRSENRHNLLQDRSRSSCSYSQADIQNCLLHGCNRRTSCCWVNCVVANSVYAY